MLCALHCLQNPRTLTYRGNRGNQTALSSSGTISDDMPEPAEDPQRHLVRGREELGEPWVIGGYHSSKALVKFCETTTGATTLLII